MNTLKKIWIKGYSVARLASIKDHCNSKSQMKTLCLVKASVLKILAEVGLKKVETSVSLEEFKRLKNKANICC